MTGSAHLRRLGCGLCSAAVGVLDSIGRSVLTPRRATLRRDPERHRHRPCPPGRQHRPSPAAGGSIGTSPPWPFGRRRSPMRSAAGPTTAPGSRWSRRRRRWPPFRRSRRSRARGGWGRRSTCSSPAVPTGFERFSRAGWEPGVASRWWSSSPTPGGCERRSRPATGRRSSPTPACAGRSGTGPAAVLILGGAFEGCATASVRPWADPARSARSQISADPGLIGALVGA